MYKITMQQGTRKAMEDRVKVVDDFYANYSLFIVCDGHGGDFVAEYCASELEFVLKKNIEDGLGMKYALEKTFKDLDDSLSLPESYMTGTTCLVILKNPEHIWIANCGDSRAIMNQNKKCIDLSRDHKPTGEEKQRIEHLGGDVLCIQNVPRVSGELALSRAIGDKRLRPYVIPTPEVKKYTLSPENKFIIMATDGLWDILRSEDVNKLVYDLYEVSDVGQTDKQLLETCAYHLDKYVSEYAMDNTSIVVLHIRR